MESTNKSQKRKKSGAENRKASKAKREENERLGSFMKSYFTTSGKSSYEDFPSGNDQGKGIKDDIENESPDKPCDTVEVVQESASLQESVSGREVSKGRVLDDEMEVQESAVSAVSFLSEFHFDSSVDGEVINHTNFTDFETGSQVPSETLNTSVPNSIEEDTIIIEQSMAPSNPVLMNNGHPLFMSTGLLGAIDCSIMIVSSSMEFSTDVFKVSLGQ